MSGPDEARDAHLRAALRHAPDAQLQAPPQLSELILHEARAKARDPRTAPTPALHWARRVWDWLARPAVATGFAGVMAATLVGLMWWDQPMDEAMPRSPVPAAAPAAQPPAAAASSIERGQPVGEPAAASPAPEPVRKTSDAPRSVTPGLGAVPSRSDVPSPRQERTERNPLGAMAGANSAPAEVPKPAPPAAPAPAAAPPTPSADTSTDATLAQARAREDEHKRERSSMAPAEVQSRRAAAKAALNDSGLQREGEAFTRVASLRAVIAGEAARWSWQHAGTGTRPMNEAIDAWLAQLDGSAGTRWQALDTREAAAPQGRVLALLRDGQRQHSFQLTERGVLWLRGQTAWHVELPAEMLAALQTALDSATR